MLSKDVLWLKYLFFTSFRLSVYSLQRVDTMKVMRGLQLHKRYIQ